MVLESPCSGSNSSAFSTSRIPFSIALVRRLSITTVFPKNQLLSQFTFLPCHSLSLTSTVPCALVRLCARKRGANAADADTTLLGTGGVHAPHEQDQDTEDGGHRSASVSAAVSELRRCGLSVQLWCN